MKDCILNIGNDQEERCFTNVSIFACLGWKLLNMIIYLDVVIE